MYLKIAATYESPSGRDVLRGDVVIANSHWTAGLMKTECGIECSAVVYPPVAAEFPSVPLKKKEFSFVMIGRVAPEKRIESAIEILEAVRNRGYSIKLHLCGHIGNDPYGRNIARLCEAHREWIVAEGEITGEKKKAILTQSRFGIHTRSAEPFGISVAEMVRAGAIVFTPDDGGQTEVVDSAELLFSDSSDAVGTICAVLSDVEKQSTLSSHLAQRSEMFSTARFMDASMAVVAAFSANAKHAQARQASQVAYSSEKKEHARPIEPARRPKDHEGSEPLSNARH